MPCNAILQQTGRLGLNPALLLQHPQLLKLIANRIATLLNAGNRMAICEPNDWCATYGQNLTQQPIAGMNFPANGALFFSDTCAIAIHPDGRIEMRDGYYLGRRPDNAAQLLAAITTTINAVAGYALQQLIMAQIATVATITNTAATPAGALILTINA